MDSNTGPLDKQAVVVYLYLRCIMPTGTNIEIPATQIHIWATWFSSAASKKARLARQGWKKKKSFQTFLLFRFSMKFFFVLILCKSDFQSRAEKFWNRVILRKCSLLLHSLHSFRFGLKSSDWDWNILSSKIDVSFETQTCRCAWVGLPTRLEVWTHMCYLLRENQYQMPYLSLLSATVQPRTFTVKYWFGTVLTSLRSWRSQSLQLTDTPGSAM